MDLCYIKLKVQIAFVAIVINVERSIKLDDNIRVFEFNFIAAHIVRKQNICRALDLLYEAEI